MSELDPKLEPKDPDHVVQTGDEEIPVSSSDPDEDRKAIYKKARANRESITREDQDSNLDVEAINRAVAEAADDPEFEHGNSDALSTENRPDRFAEEDPSADPEYVEPEYNEDDPPAPAASADPPKKVVKPAKELDYEATDGMVAVKIYGKEYQVPEEDVIASGGVKQYQIHRAANQQLERAATQARALQAEREQLAQPQSDGTAKGDPPATGDLDEKAELERLEDELFDTAFDGTKEEFRERLNQGLQKFRGQKKQNAHGDPAQKPASDRVVEEYQANYKIARAEANREMMDNFPDIINDADLKQIAHRKYVELESDPANFGRTPTEMVMQAGRHARAVSRKGVKTEKSTQQQEIETRRAKKRVLIPNSEARRRSPAPAQPKTRSNSDYIRDLQKAQGNRG